MLEKAVEDNPLIWIHLKALKLMGYMIFDDQGFPRVHCFRGVVLTFSFILFNITQVTQHQINFTLNK